MHGFLNLVIFCLLVGYTFAQENAQQPPKGAVRVCVPRDVLPQCQRMQDKFPREVYCVGADDRFHCLHQIRDGLADVVNVDAETLYAAGKYFKLHPILMEELSGRGFKYEGVAVVQKNSSIGTLQDLRGSKSCHTGAGRTAGWNIPLGVLLQKGVLKWDCRGDLATFSNFFTLSCASGLWSNDLLLDTQLKCRYNNLCGLCQDPTCTTLSDPYFGYEGALRCLADGRGQVAFTKGDAVEEFFHQRPQSHREEFEYLCLNGSRAPIQGQQGQAPCPWAQKPTNVFVSIHNKDNEEAKRFVSVLRKVFDESRDEKPSWMSSAFVSGSKVTRLLPLPEDKKFFESYLGNYLSSIEREGKECPRQPVRFCVNGDLEARKCHDLAVAATSRRITPEIQCVRKESHQECIQAVARREADLITLDGGDMYKAGRYYNLRPVAIEQYKDGDQTYYAVAVVKKDSGITRLEDLRGKRSCHTGYGRTAGWVIPVGTLMDKGLLRRSCSPAQALASFFNGSCVPGVGSDVTDDAKSVEALCRQCAGDETGKGKCQRGGQERYEGYAGAFRCLAEGKGDVAFVKHETGPSLTDGASGAPWAKGLRSEDFRLLCRDGGQAFLQEHTRCELARVPAHHVMTSSLTPHSRWEQMQQLLVGVGDRFGPQQGDFRLFAPYRHQSHLLFKDGVQSLAAEPTSHSYRAALGEDFYKANELLDPKQCDL